METRELPNGDIKQFTFESDGAFSVAEPLWFFRYSGFRGELAEEQVVFEPITWALCLRPDFNLHLSASSDGHPRMFLTSPEDKKRRGLTGRRHVFDPRILGLAGVGGLSSIGLDQAMEHFRGFVTSAGFSANAQGDGVYELVKTRSIGDQSRFLLRMSYVVDVGRGFTIRSVMHEQFFSGAGGELVPLEEYLAREDRITDDELPMPRSYRQSVRKKQQLSWEEMNGVWVPTSIQSERIKMKDEVNWVPYRFEATFDWESVGEVLPESLFDVHHVAISPDTQVFDAREGDPEYVGLAGQRSGPEEAQEFSARAYIAAGILGLMIVGFLGYHRYRSRISTT